MSAAATEPAIDGWRSTPLKAEVTLKNGKAYNAADWKKEGYPIIRIQNLKNPLAEFNYFQGDPETEVPIRSGDLVFSWSGSKGTSFGPHIWRGELGVLNQHIFKVVMNPDSQLGQDFLYYALRFLTAAIEDKAYGLAALVHIRKGDLESTPIPLPPLPEQKKIAHILSTVQRAIEAQERIIQTTTELKKALTHKLFTEGLRNEPQKQTEIGPVPESWEVMRFDELAVLQRGFDITKKNQRPGDFPVVSSGGIASYHDEAKVTGPGVVIGRKGSLGTVHYIASDYWPHDTTLWVKDFKGNNPRFVAYLLETMQLKRFDTGAANPTLNRNIVHGEKIAIPPKDQQVEIGEALEAVESKISIHERRKRSFQDLFRTLLHELMTAKIRVDYLSI